jgi:hypothetical protein
MFHGEYEDFQEGWLVFESATERRRLAPFPGRWASLPMEQLEELLARAVRVRTSGETRAGGETRMSGETRAGTFRRIEEERVRREEEAARAASEDLSPLPSEPVVPPWRTFTGPSGRLWTAGEVERDDPSLPEAERRALRFTADSGAACELAPFPDDWARLPRERLFDLLKRATPTAVDPADKRPPRRRRQDFSP